MDKATLSNKLQNRQPPINGAASAPVAPGNGPKLTEAASYLKSARICLLTWVRSNYVNAENVDHNTQHVRDILAIAEGLEGTRATLDVKASILGK